ncbi:MAG: hypothetical protein C4518_10390 [Desulfobacteraceae bacterium]|nr:MAG: hypothetical protein C4518_10390 [Desulfobacteraceae bacterium]
MLMRWIFLFVLVAMTTIGCATNCQNVQQKLDVCQATLTDQDFIIKKQESTIRQKDEQIAGQNKTIEKMGVNIAELERQLDISSNEKGRKDERVRDIAASVREYIQKQMRENTNFLTGIALEDFVGDELIQREHSGDEKMMIVNVAHPVPSGGQINGIGGYFSGTSDVIIKLLRPVGNDYVVIYNKELKFEAEGSGKTYVDFDSPFIVKKGDVIAYYFPGPVNVPYDSNIGTNAYSEMGSDEYAQGDRIAAEDIWHADQVKRKYSLNYYGIFYTRVGSE